MAASEPQYPQRILLHHEWLLLQDGESTSAMLEYEPAAQGVHVVLPVSVEYVPLAHGMHAARP